MSLGAPEIIILVLVAIVLLGWKKLPDMARSVGRSMRIFKSEVSEMKNDGKSGSTSETVQGSVVPPPSSTPYPSSPGAPGNTSATATPGADASDSSADKPSV